MLTPYLLWTIFYTLVSHLSQLNLFGKKLISNVFTGGAATPLYYILLLLQMELILPFVIIGMKNRYIKIGMWLITPLYMVYVYSYYYKTGIHPPLYGTLFPAYFIFYMLGLEIKSDRSRIIQSQKLSVILSILALALSIVEGFLLSSSGMPSFGVSQLKASSFLYAASIVILLIKHERVTEEKGRMTRTLRRIGDDSYAIFYLHCFCLKIINVIIQKIEIVQSLPWLIVVAIYFVITVIMCEIIIHTVRSVFGKIGISRYLKYIGF